MKEEDSEDEVLVANTDSHRSDMSTSPSTTELSVDSNRRRSTCTVCNKRLLTTRMKRHMLTHNRPSLITCKVCERQFSHQSHLETHMRVHMGQKPFVCCICRRGFSMSTTLKVHMDKHELYTCNMCSKQCMSLYDLVEHIYTHTDVPQYTCHTCQMQFFEVQSFLMHMRAHGDEQLFTCGICGRGFILLRGLRDHILRHVCIMPYRCTLCSKTFTTVTHLKSHMHYHTGDKICSLAIFVNLHS